MYSMVEKIKTFKVECAGLVNLVNKLQTDYVGKDFITAVKAFESFGFCVIKKREGVKGIYPFFNPRRVYLYYNEHFKLCHVHYV